MRKRILRNYITILIISALLTGALAFYFINNSYTDSKKEKLQTNMTLIENDLETRYKKYEKVNFYRLAQQLSREINSRVTFVDLEGCPISDSINNSIILRNQSNTNEFKIEKVEDGQLTKSYSKEVGKKYFYLSKAPVRVGDKHVLLRLGDSYDEVYRTIEKFFFHFAVANLISIFTVIVLAFISSGKIVKPIKELTLASRDISRGNFKNRIKSSSKDEIGELSSTFNQMARKLEKNISRLKEKNIQMNAILSSIQDGILALDLDKKIFLVNDSINKILENPIQVKRGQYIKSIFKDIEVLQDIDEKINKMEDYYDEIELKRISKTISISMYPIIQNGKKIGRIGTLIVIRDITKIRNLEKMRKDFVANVSHELRTPLTSIGGFVETLKIKELDEKNKKKALDIIELETEKLKDMINELLKLSKIESIKETRESVEINIENEVNEVLSLLRLQANKKNIDIILNMERDLNKIYGHRELFRLVFINIVENSIKYNKLYGKIDITVSNFKKGIKLIVEDTGIGISDEDIPWIFERFYRSKNVRSEDEKGTGLGLSIVDEIVKYMDGEIKVYSKLDKGTKFEIILRA